MTFIVKWRLLADEKPQDGKMCHIGNSGGSHIITDVPWNAQMAGFVDLFATPEAGHVYNEGNGVDMWVPADEIDMINGIPDESAKEPSR